MVNPEGPPRNGAPFNTTTKETKEQNKITRARRRIFKINSDDEPLIGDEWLVLSNSLKLASDITHADEELDVSWSGSGLTDLTVMKAVQIQKVKSLNSDGTMDTEDEEGVARRRLFGRVPTVVDS